MNYTIAKVPESIWNDKGVELMTAKRPNPNNIYAETVDNDPTILENGTYIIDESNKLYRAKDDSNLIISMIHGSELPKIEKWGEKIDNPFNPHIHLQNKKDVAKTLNDLNAVYLVTLESYGRNEDILKKDMNVTVSVTHPRVKVRTYQLMYLVCNENILDVTHFELNDQNKINKILKDAGISKNTEGLYQLIK